MEDFVTRTPTLNLVGARKALDAAEAAALERGLRLGIAVADAAGNLLAFIRMDGAPLVSIAVAAEKARTAAQLGCATKVLQEMADGDHPSLIAVRDLIPVEGGLPVIIDGVVVGAVAASGAASADDAEVAGAGVNAIGRYA